MTHRPTRPEIVVIAASAGGVQALSALLRQLPTDLQAAVLVVLHTPSGSPGLAAAVLTRASALPAALARDRERFEPGRVFVAPPDHHLLVDGPRLRLVRGPRENGVRPAADPLFRSAARSHGPRVVGVILSGALDDGTAGLHLIKEAGGLAIVQDPAEALFSGMPLSAIQGVDVDHVLPIAQIAKLIGELASVPARRSSENSADSAEGASAGISDPTGAETSDPAAMTCPECGGALAEDSDGAVVRFRCHVGHAYGSASLLAFQSDALERALWTALRTLEETAALRRSMAARAGAGGLQALEQAYHQQALRADRNAELIRGALTREEGPAGAAAGDEADSPEGDAMPIRERA